MHARAHPSAVRTALERTNTNPSIHPHPPPPPRRPRRVLPRRRHRTSRRVALAPPRPRAFASTRASAFHTSFSHPKVHTHTPIRTECPIQFPLSPPPRTPPNPTPRDPYTRPPLAHHAVFPPRPTTFASSRDRVRRVVVVVVVVVVATSRARPRVDSRLKTSSRGGWSRRVHRLRVRSRRERERERERERDARRRRETGRSPDDDRPRARVGPIRGAHRVRR